MAAGQRNVWGVQPARLCTFTAYASPGGDPYELRAAIAALHDAGIEVWLDVVFNHTCEGGLGTGPILSWRGFDNAATAWLRAGEHGLVDDDVTGCGNGRCRVAPRAPARASRSCAGLEELGVDGFRFDLAATLLRGPAGPRPDAPLLAELANEPRLQVRLVAEPWTWARAGTRWAGSGPLGGVERPVSRRRPPALAGRPGGLVRGGRHPAHRGSADLLAATMRLIARDHVRQRRRHPRRVHHRDLVTYGQPVEGGHAQGSNSGLEA
ncbi:MAG: hypothetical protein U0P45_10770 [Acidimicrobiales bacterium]